MRTRHANRTRSDEAEPAPLPVVVGWNGLTVRVPEGWSPVAVSGEGAQGYVKVVSPDTRHLEIKWEKPRGRVSVPDALERYLKRLRKSARRSRMDLDVKLRPKSLGRPRPEEQAPVAYTWEAAQRSAGCIWHCGVCGRLVIAEVVGGLEDDLSLASEVLRGIQDHGEGDWNTWSLYGLTVPAPAAFAMEKQVLMTGHQQFQLRRGGTRLQADRWGLAEIALRGTTVREWFESREQTRLARYVYRFEETELHGHTAYRLAGRDRVPTALLKLLRFPMTLIWPSFFVRGYLWRCETTNRIFSVLAEQSRKSTLLEEVAARMPCHA